MGRHAIHLGSAWEAADRDAAASSRVAGDGHVAWRRWFHRPTRLVAGDRLLLCWERAGDRPEEARLSINGQDVPREAGAVAGQLRGSWEYDVTDLVSDRNELLLRLPAAFGGAAARGGRFTLPAAWGRLSLVVVSD